jgi:hypothetical protein
VFDGTLGRTLVGNLAFLGFSVLAIVAHWMLLSPPGYREPSQIHRIVREKARVQGAMPVEDYDHALHVDHPEAPSLLSQYLDQGSSRRPRGKPKGSASAEEP